MNEERKEDNSNGSRWTLKRSYRRLKVGKELGKPSKQSLIVNSMIEHIGSIDAELEII